MNKKYFRIVYQFTEVFGDIPVAVTDDFPVFTDSNHFLYKGDLQKIILDHLKSSKTRKGHILSDEIRIVDMKEMSKFEYDWYFYGETEIDLKTESKSA